MSEWGSFSGSTFQRKGGEKSSQSKDTFTPSRARISQEVKWHWQIACTKVFHKFNSSHEEIKIRFGRLGRYIVMSIY